MRLHCRCPTPFGRAHELRGLFVTEQVLPQRGHGLAYHSALGGSRLSPAAGVHDHHRGTPPRPETQGLQEK